MYKGSFATAVNEDGQNFQRFNFRSNGWEVFSQGDIFRPEGQVDLSRTYVTKANPSTAPVMDQASIDYARTVAEKKAGQPAKHHWWDRFIPHRHNNGGGAPEAHA